MIRQEDKMEGKAHVINTPSNHWRSVYAQSHPFS
jgi:hypothetical protein